MIRIYQLASNSVCAPYRLQFPGELLNLMPDFRVEMLRRLNAATFRHVITNADLFVIQRLPASRRLAKAVSALSSRGVIVIYEIDDDLIDLPRDVPYGKEAPQNYGDLIQKGMMMCHGVQCSTQALAEKIAAFHPDVRVLQNQLEAVPVLREKSSADLPIVVLPVGENHLADWLAIRDDFNEKISDLERHGYGVEIWVLGDREVFESVKVLRKRYFPLMARQDYLKVLQKADVAVLPLRDTPFNRCKSDVKLLECASAGLAVLASDIVYGDSIVPGKTGQTFSDSAQFRNLLGALLTNAAERLRLGRKAYQYVKSQRLLHQHINEWSETYEQWRSGRDNLLQNSRLKYQETPQISEIRDDNLQRV